MSGKFQNVEKKNKYRVKRAGSGLGLFAASRFRKNEFVIEYVGKKLTGKDAEGRYNKYLFEINSKLTIDGSSRKNIARYVNHSCRPNCEVRIYAKRVRIWTTCPVKPGEEFTYDYGKEYFDEYIKPFGCKCANCRSKKRR